MAAPTGPYAHIPPGGPPSPPPPPPPSNGPVLAPVPLPYPHVDVAPGARPGLAAQPAARRDLMLRFDGRGVYILRKRGGALGFPALAGPGARRPPVPVGAWWIVPRDVSMADRMGRIPLVSAARDGRGGGRGYAILGGAGPGATGGIDLGAGFKAFARQLSFEIGPDRSTRIALEVG